MVFARVGLAAMGVGVGLVAMEMLIRLSRASRTGYHPWPPNLKRIVRLIPGVLPGVEGESRFRVNSAGMRGRERPVDCPLAVLTVGGSTTECRYLDQSAAWPARLERLLAKDHGEGAWVANAGKAGTSSRDNLLLLDHLPDLERFDVVIVVAGVNDLLSRLARGDGYDPHVLDKPEGRRRHLRRAFHVLPLHHSRHRPFPRNTAVWRSVVPAVRRLLARLRVQEGGGSVYVEWRKLRRERGGTLTELPRLGEALGEYRRNLVTMIERCREFDARVVLVTQPFLWSADMPPEHEELIWLGGVGRFKMRSGAPYYSPGALAEGMTRYNEVLIEVGRDHGVEVVDLAAELPRDTSVLYDDVHFNEQGARLAAQHLAEALRR